MRTPLLFVLGFFFILVIGGLTGIMLGLGAARPAGARHLLRRRAPALRADRRRRLPALRRHLLLVSQDHRPDAERAARPLALLAVLHRLQRDVLSDAPARPRGHAAAHLHLRGRDWAGARSTCSSTIGACRSPLSMLLFVVNVVRSLLQGRARGRQSVGRRHARMGDVVAAAARTTSTRCPWSSRASRCGSRTAMPAQRRDLGDEDREGLMTTRARRAARHRDRLSVPDDLAVLGARSRSTILFIGRSSRRGRSSGGRSLVAFIARLVLAAAAGGDRSNSRGRGTAE